MLLYDDKIDSVLDETTSGEICTCPPSVSSFRTFLGWAHKPQWAVSNFHKSHGCWMAINLQLVLLSHPHTIDTNLIKFISGMLINYP